MQCAKSTLKLDFFTSTPLAKNFVSLFAIFVVQRQICAMKIVISTPNDGSYRKMVTIWRWS